VSNQFNNFDRAVYFGIGLAGGYLLRVWTAPIPVPHECPGGGTSRPVTQSMAQKLLDANEFLDDSSPMLRSLAEGDTPSPSQAYQFWRRLRED
jgi:hypothetical protein